MSVATTLKTIGLAVAVAVGSIVVAGSASAIVRAAKPSEAAPAPTYAQQGVTLEQFNNFEVGTPSDRISSIIPTGYCHLTQRAAMAGIKSVTFTCKGRGSIGANMIFMVQKSGLTGVATVVLTVQSGLR